VNLALSALAELEAEITGRLGEPAVRQLRGTLLQILDRPASPAPVRRVTARHDGDDDAAAGPAG
jgi:hypothetical protein